MSTRLNDQTGKWFYRFSRKGKSCQAHGYRTKQQASDAERKAFDREIQKENHPELFLSDAALTFREAGTLFLENYSKKHKRSWDIDEMRLAVLTDFFKDKKVSEITPENIQAFLDKIKEERGLKDLTLNHYLALTKCLFNWLFKHKKYVGENPARADVLPMKDVPRARVRFMYPVEEKILSPVMSQDAVLSPFYQIGRWTGMRLSEILALKVKDISLTARYLFISNSKTSRSRTIPINESLATFLEIWIKDKNLEDYVTTQWTRNYISHRFTKVCKQVNVLNFTAHCLRHTFAADLLTKGVPIYTVAKLLGNSVKVCEEHYGHLAMQDLKSAVDVLDKPVAVILPLMDKPIQQKNAVA